MPAVVILLGLLVFFHELGHFVVGRLCGIAVETFSIGFGPRIFGFTLQGTEYRVSWIPLGGYVKFAGAHSSEEMPAGLPGNAFIKTSLGKRALTVVAGPFANFVLAVLVYMILGMDGIPHPPPVIGDVIEGSAAMRAGIQYGDRFVQIDDRKIVTWRDLEEKISTSPKKTLTVTVDRAGGPVEIRLTPEEIKTTDMLGRPLTIGRAGVALGRMPPILTVLSSHSAAGRAGIKTGDRIVGIDAFPAFEAMIRKSQTDPAVTTLTLQVRATTPPRDTGADARTQEDAVASGDARTVTLDVTAIKGMAPTAPDSDVLAVLGVRDSQLTLAEATDGAAEVLQVGDVVQKWNGTPVKDVFALREQLIANTASSASLTVLRGDQTVEVTLPLKGIETQRPEGPVTVYTMPTLFWGQPVEPPPIVEKYGNPFAAFAFGVRQTVIQTNELIGNVAALVTGDIPLKALGGPMLIAKVAGDSARRGWQTFLGSMALISINLGLLNLFPIPVLDGGQLLLMGAEAVKRRPLRETAVENFQKVGFAMILALVVLATYNDLSRFWKSMLESVVGIFQ